MRLLKLRTFEKKSLIYFVIFPAGLSCKHMGEITFIGEISIEFLCGPHRILLFHWLTLD